MKILNRAKHLYSDEYFTSESVIIEYGNMFLLIGDVRVECDISTRSINLSDMVDSEGTKIFASLSEDGKGGDMLFHTHKITGNTITLVAKYKAVNARFEAVTERHRIGFEKFHLTKVTGIQQ